MPTIAWATGTPALAQNGTELASQLPAGVGIDGGADALVRGVQGGMVWMHALEWAGNLLRRPVPAQHGADQEPEVSIRMELGWWACMEAPLLASVLGGGTGIPLIAAVASQLTADGAGTAPLQVGDGSHAPALLAQRCQCHPFFSLQMFVSRFQMRTLPGLGSVALRIGDPPFSER